MVFSSFDFNPSGLSVFRCKCGIILSNTSKNTIPSKNPTVAGTHSTIFCVFAISIDGIKSDHTDAAIITPEANPNNNFSIFLFILFFIRKTIAEPNVVPKNGINSPYNIFIFIHTPYKKITIFYGKYITSEK